MKKKAIKIAASTAVAASAFVAAAPAQQADAATNVNQLVTDAQNAGTVLKWAISVEGSADYVTRPYDKYNAAKKAIAAAEAAAKKLSASEKLSVDAKLVEPKLQVKRAAAYIDAITSSEKIKDLTSKLDAAIKTDDIEKVETAYHAATGEYRKQAALLDRVYGQSTRDGIRNAVKPAIEKLVASVKNEVTVNMLAKAAAVDAKASKFEDASKKLTEAQAILDANVLKWEAALQKSVKDAYDSIELQVLSVARVNDNTVTIKFSKPVEAVLPAGQFVFDNGLTVSAAVVSDDRKSVTLTTSTQKVGTTYTLYYQGKATGKSFTTPASATDNSFFVDQADVARIEVGQTRTYKVTVKNADLTNYNGQVTINTNAGTTAELLSVNGVATSGDTASVTVPYNGVLTIVVTGTTGNAAGFEPTVTRVDTKKELKLGKTFVYQPAADNLTITSNTTFNGFHDKTNNYFTVSGTKYKYDANDVFHILGNVVTLDQFKAALSYNDTFTVTQYKAEATGSSVFNITSDITFAGVEFTNPEKEVTYDGYGMNYRFEGEGNNGYTVYLYNNLTNGLVGTAVVSSGKWTVQAANLGTPGQSPTFTAVQVAPGQTEAQARVNLENVKVSSAVLVGPYEVGAIGKTFNGDGVIGFGDQLDFTFSYFTANPLNDLKVGSSATITVKDSLSKKATYKVEKVDRDSIKITDVLSSEAGYDNKEATSHRIDSVTGITNQDNLVLKVKDGLGF